jgi:hypothetical protein
MPRHLQFRAPGHGKLPNDPNNKLKIDPLAFLGDDPWAEMAEDILFGALNTMLQIIDYATGLDLLPAAKMLEDAFVGSTFMGPAFDDFVSYLEAQPATDAVTGLPTPGINPTGMLTALLRWLTLGFGAIDAGETLLSKLITAAGGTGSTLDEFGELFTGLASVAVGDITGLATGVESWLVDGGSLPSSTSLGLDQLTGLAVGFEEWLASGGPLPDATSIGVTQLSGLASGVESWLADGGLLPAGTTAAIDNIIDLPGQLSTMFSPFNPPHLIGVGQITTVAQNLLKNATFATADALKNETVFVWDSISHASSGGSAKVLANINSNTKALLSDPISVANGDTINASVHTQWDSLVYTGAPIALKLNIYDIANTLITQVTMQAATMTGATSSWVNLAGSHPITETGAYWVRLVFEVANTATAGSVWFSNSSLTKPNLLPQNAIGNLPADLLDITTRAQDTLDAMGQAIFGTAITGYLPADIKAALSAIPYPNVSGLLGGADVGATIQDFVDHGVQGIVDDPGTLIDQTLATFKTQMSSFARFVGFVTSGAAPPNSVANIASNVDNTVKARAVQKPPSANIDPTLDATFDFHQIWQNATLPTVSSTSGVTVMGDITIRDGGIKQAVTWYGYPSGGNFGAITDFRVNIWSVSKTNNVRTLVHSSANLVASVGTGTAPVFNSYNLPTQISCAAGDKLTVELAILGTGTYLVVGQTLSAQVPVHPSYGLHALTRASATAPATMNPPGVGGSPASYTRSVPLLGLSGVASQTQYSPVIIPFYGSGTFDPSIYTWANHFDVVQCSAGGCGGGGGPGAGSTGGNAGSYNGVALTKAQMGTSLVSVNVPGQGPTVTSGANGPDGGAGNVVVPGYGTINSPAGGTGGITSGSPTSIGQPGASSSGFSFNGQYYSGGPGGGSPQAAGSQPGGGGAGGNSVYTNGQWFYGGPGGAGVAYIRAYQ